MIDLPRHRHDHEDGRRDGHDSDAAAATATATATTAPSMVRHEEDLELGTERREYGSVRVQRRVDEQHVQETIGREIQHADVERAEAVEGDSGEVEHLADGTISIPVFEERLVVTKQLFVRERLIVRRRVEVEDHVVEADLRREHVVLDVDEGVRGAVSGLDQPR